jgi:hypothetical protein
LQIAILAPGGENAVVVVFEKLLGQVGFRNNSAIWRFPS